MNLNEKKLLDKKTTKKTNVGRADPWDFYLPGIIMEKLKAIQHRKLIVLKIDINITISFSQKNVKTLRISPYT